MRTRYRTIAVVLVAVVAVGMGLFFFVEQPQKLYRVTILSSLGGAQMVATSVNDRGQVVGVAQAADGQCHLFLWDRQGGIQDLGVTEKGRADINNAGQIAGSMADPNGNQRAFLWRPDKGRRFLGTLGGRTSRAMAINNRGEIVGHSARPNGSDHAFLWDETQGMRDLGTLGGPESQARAINDAGVVFGYSDTPTQQAQPFVWDANGGMTAVGLSPETSPLNGINNGAWLVGGTRFPGRGNCMAVWRKGEMPRELFPVDMAIVPNPPLINDANQVVFAGIQDDHPWWLPRRLLFRRPLDYLWDPNHGMVRLNPYKIGRWTESFLAMDINNKGCVVGVVLFGPGDSRGRAVVLEPIAERWKK